MIFLTRMVYVFECHNLLLYDLYEVSCGSTFVRVKNKAQFCFSRFSSYFSSKNLYRNLPAVSDECRYVYGVSSTVLVSDRLEKNQYR